MNLFRSAPSAADVSYPMPFGFANQFRAFPTYPQPAGLIEHPGWNGAYYAPAGPGQTWIPMSGSPGTRPVSVEGRDLSSLYGPTASRLAAAAAPSAELMNQQRIPLGATSASNFYSPDVAQAPVPTASDLVVDIDPVTGRALAVDGRPAYDVASRGLEDQVVLELTPFLSNRPMPSITATARGAFIDSPGMDGGIGCWANEHKALAVIGVVGLYLLLKGGK